MDHKVLWCDLETTGTDSVKNGIIQAAGIIEINGEEKESFDFKIKPFETDKVDNEALAVSNTTIKDLESYEDPFDVKAKIDNIFSKYIDKYDKTDKFIFAGYNVNFDYSFLYNFFKKCNDNYLGSYIWYPVLDVMTLAMARVGAHRYKLDNFRLGTVAQAFKVEADGELHDALTDVRLTKKLYESLFQRPKREV